jgi:hypothetical protein
MFTFIVSFTVIVFTLILIIAKIKQKTPAIFNANSKYITEANMVSALGNKATGSGVQNFFPVSFPVEEINIRVYRDTEKSLADYKTFDFDYTNKTNPLLEKELFHQLEKILQTNGLTRAKKNPQIIISMDFFIGKKEQYTPPTTVTNTEMKSVWNFGMLGWNVGGFSSEIPITTSNTTPGYTTTSYYSNIRLNFLDHAKLAEGEKLETPPLIWLGEAENQGLNSDIRAIASMMFNELIGEFPNPSNKNPKRFVSRFCYGGLGLGFDPSDWRIIRYVEPSSVAAEHNIKPGDVLLTINGEPVGNWPNFSYWHSNSPGLYTSKDPCFKYILSNHGDSEVDLLIKTPRKWGKTSIKLIPRNEDRYVNVTT